MFGKSFASMYSGSMFGQPAAVFAVWGYIISHQRPAVKGGQCFVELNPAVLAATFSTSPDEIVSAIDILCSPDERSRSKAMGGRRLALADGQERTTGPMQFLVVNGDKYRAMRDEEERMAYNRDAKRKERSKLTVIDSVGMSAQAEEEAEAEAEAEADSYESASSGASPPTARKEKPEAIGGPPLAIAELLLSEILAHSPKLRRPKIQAWARTFDLMLRLDKRDPAESAAVIRFATSDPFWRANILSAETFRAKYDQLAAKMDSQGRASGSSSAPSNPEWSVGHEYTPEETDREDYAVYQSWVATQHKNARPVSADGMNGYFGFPRAWVRWQELKLKYEGVTT